MKKKSLFFVVLIYEAGIKARCNTCDHNLNYTEVCCSCDAFGFLLICHFIVLV